MGVSVPPNFHWGLQVVMAPPMGAEEVEEATVRMFERIPFLIGLD